MGWGKEYDYSLEPNEILKYIWTARTVQLDRYEFYLFLNDFNKIIGKILDGKFQLTLTRKVLTSEIQKNKFSCIIT